MANLAKSPARQGKCTNPSGRPKGSQNKRSKEQDDMLTDMKVQGHLLPLDFLILNMNNQKNSAAFRIKCAVEALPYCHRRMPIGVDDGRGGPIKHLNFAPADLLALNDEQLVELIVRLETMNGGEDARGA